MLFSALLLNCISLLYNQELSDKPTLSLSSFFMSFFEAIDAGSFALISHVSGILWNDVMFDDGLLLFVIVRQESGW